MDINEIVSGLILEMRRGTIVMLVLSQLKKPMYGYMLVKKLSDNGVTVQANTLYPLMRRLETQGLLKSEWDTGESKPRKYYETTEMGKEVLTRIEIHWSQSVTTIDKLLKGENNE